MRKKNHSANLERISIIIIIIIGRVRILAKSPLCLSACKYVCSHVSARLPLDNFYVKFDIGDFYENISGKLNFITKLDKT
jgi:hypothetical protein